MKKIFALYITCLFSVCVFAQEETIRCGNALHQAALQAEYPDFKENVNAKLTQATMAISQAQHKSNDVVYTLPVVVHVVHKNSTENISDIQIQSQLDILNLDYRRMNADVGQVPGLFANLAADAEIEFCLASVDPNGNSTTGITRTQTNVNSFSVTSDNVKSDASGGKSPWDTNRYLNIWICQITGGTLGYATPPGTPASRDGVVIGYTYFGDTGTATFPYNEGRTGTHEVGHYLGLRHIWGDGNCGIDDGINDTPLQEAGYGGCPNFGSTSTISCGSQDMFMNYMDYTNDACMFMFTQNQVDLMRYVIENYRSTLMQSSAVACDPTGGAGCRDLEDGSLTMGFEDGENFGSWDIVNNNGDSNLWEQVNNDQADPEVAGSRSGSNFIVYSYNTYNNADDWFFSPCIDLKAGRDYKLSFWYATAEGTNTAYPEKLGIALTLSPLPDFTTYQDLSELAQPYNSGLPNNNYAKHELEFFTETDATIHIGFHCHSDADQFALMIDDINIIDITTVSTQNTIASEAFQVYPNPVSDQLVVDFNFDKTIENLQVNLVDLTGKIIHTTTLENYATGNLQLDVNQYPSGVYFLQVQADKQMTTEKIVISD